MPELTPMLKQYMDIKEKYKTELLLFRLGDFYEMFGEDAKEASRILDIVLTARCRGTEHETPMCGIPYHALGNYLAKLIKAGKRVAICDQMTDPSLPGLVQREVTRVVTPGTTFDELNLQNKINNNIVAVVLGKNAWGLAIADLTTGDFRVAETPPLARGGETPDFNLLKNEIFRFATAEVIVNADLFNDTRYRDFLLSLSNVNDHHLTMFENARAVLLKHFGMSNLNSFGVDNMTAGVDAAGLLLDYLKETQKAELKHFTKIVRHNFADYMALDEATIRNLEIFQTAFTGRYDGSLVSVIDRTKTSMAGRLLRRWLILPLVKEDKINERLTAVADFKTDLLLLRNLTEKLKQLSDLERLLGRLGCRRGTARDLVALKKSLLIVPEVKELIWDKQSIRLQNLNKFLGDHAELVSLLEKTIMDEPAAIVNDGNMIKDGVDADLDELRKISRGGKDYLMQIQTREIERTKINSLKVRFNSVFGYYIEISKANLDQVPTDYIRKQTLVNAERFITPELKEYEEKILGAEEKIKVIEYRIFQETVEKASAHFADVQRTAESLAEVDLLASFAELANENNYCRPIVNATGVINVTAGRHPVIERFNKDRYVPNDLILDHEKNEFILLTGPNMSGKSSFLRQAALISLLAQIGSFVPAESAELGVVDRIFTRVGASDNLTQGVSTFMAEMQEAANILNNATRDSLIILDELGRGTSTYDGVSIAWAIMEHVHNQVGAKTIFATHYHELTDIVGQLARAENYCVAVSEDNGKVVFLHKIVRGATSKSYGIEVAKLAGLPKELVERANDILVELESRKELKLEERAEQVSLFGLNQKLGPFDAPCSESAKGAGLAQGDKQELERIKKELEGIDIEKMTPLEALGKLAEWQKRIIKR
ncbi:DNA mismatch repair protein MutS [Candidatus Falkowbacteria bacterium RIFOXYC2_FULL_48_21]|uniref:DNA mismatch repair protein MutS n=1 Tax=Candidatus Falkowbacteria bacterium RIFOXYC2_FULL_48_21 TaxID=1798005 RepID=A0A1F5TD80_9BACT|nr:MAG: DNA mismatch repair protein MutS [Candidatus Falkowbacteria bacterium RIFOXYC2_FULL_48_21]